MALVFVRMIVLEEKRTEVWQTITSLAAHIKKEEGCADSGFFQSTADETEFLFLTYWTDRNALDAYLKSVQFTVLLGIRSLLKKEPMIRICEDEPFRQGS